MERYFTALVFWTITQPPSKPPCYIHSCVIQAGHKSGKTEEERRVMVCAMRGKSRTNRRMSLGCVILTLYISTKALFRRNLKVYCLFESLSLEGCSNSLSSSPFLFSLRWHGLSLSSLTWPQLEPWVRLCSWTWDAPEGSPALCSTPAGRGHPKPGIRRRAQCNSSSQSCHNTVRNTKVNIWWLLMKVQTGN